MALSLDEIQSVTQDFWFPNAVDNFYNANVLMQRLLKGGRTASGGEKIRQPFWHGEPIGGAFGENSTFDTTRRDQINAARFDWAYYYEPVTYGMKDKVQNSGPEAEVNTIMTKLNMAQSAIRDKMGDDIYLSLSQGATKPLTGLQAMINSTSATTYGGVAEDDLPEWKPAAVNTTAEALTLPVMRTMKRTAKVGNSGQEKPTIYLTTDQGRDTYEALLQPQQRFTDSKLAAAGFDNLTFDGGKPVVGDTKCPDGFMFGLNENFIEFVSHKDFKFHAEPWMRPTNQYLFTMQLLWVGNLVCSRRNAQTSHSGLTDA